MLRSICCSYAVVLIVLCFAVDAQAWRGSNPFRGSRFRARTSPNIIFVLADDLGYPDIGYHGGAGQGIKTPTLDSLAKEGIKLENYYGEPGSSPARGTLLSGMLPIHTGLQNGAIGGAHARGLPLDLTLLPEQLKSNGYSTHMIGRWHLGMFQEEYLPNNRGFDTYYGCLQGSIDKFSHQYIRTDRETDITYAGLDFFNDTTPDFSRVGEYSDIVFTEEAVRIIDAKDKTSPPMFMYVALTNGHDPYQVPERFSNQYLHIENTDRRALAGQITALDESVLNITKALKRNGLWENTIFIFSGSNGAPTQAMGRVGTNYPLRGDRRTFFEGGIRVTGFISGPKAPRRRAVYNGQMHISDWFPTLLNAAGIKVPKGLDGVNQWKALQGRRRGSPRNEIVFIDPVRAPVGVMKEGSPFDNRIQAYLRMGDMKLLTGDTQRGGRYPPVFTEADQTDGVAANALEVERFNSMNPADIQNIFLYNIKDDPYEITDLSQALPGTVDVMLARLAVYSAGSVPSSNVPLNYPDADPALRGGVWVPWQDMEGNLINLVPADN